ncbi:molybdenum ABC transporter ATP-binding protein [Curtobacterium sp. MCPF17_011]|uniref:ABC transporter ATP-binding protein n=1 Tax=Curtobacterium sp. MCPF17_011 TaxID=2175652 RepID=UPI000DA83329|nr:ABC transporter ATP-binding protein [Curtobacterium sp. MCPF17_011]PZF13888.1 molybdenum ABC transporter ATP-binding protein [Curtobacterium sp. MCPF17_011]
MTAAHTDAAGLVAHVVRHDRDVDVALTVGPAECVALIGPNGAGKSTVVDAVAGLLALDAGEVRSAGRLLAGPGRSVPAHRRRVGLVAQRPDLFPHRSVLANVAFGPRAAGRSGREARLTARQALAAVGVADLADRAPGTLSGGQAQRVAIARALAADPAVVLLDEPTSALDVGARQEVRAALRSAVAGRPSLLVTHDPVEVMALADRVVVLEDGHVVEEGRPAEVLARPRSVFAATFSGLVVLHGTATADGVVLDHTTTTDGTATGTAPDGGGELASGTHGVPPGRAVSAAHHPTAALVTRADQDGTGLLRTVTGLEPRDGLVRMRAGELTADLTLAAVAALGLTPGLRVRVRVPPAELTVWER